MSRPNLTPALAHLVRETDRNRKAALAATVQAEIDAAKHAKTVALTQFARIAERHDLLLTALTDNNDRLTDDAPEGAERQG